MVPDKKKTRIMQPKSRRNDSRSTSPSKGPGNIVDSAIGNPFAQFTPTGLTSQTPVFGQSSQPTSVFGQTSASFPPSSSTNQNNPLFGGGGNASASFTQPSTGSSTGQSAFGFFSANNQANPFNRDFQKEPLAPQISFGGSMFSVDSKAGKPSTTFGIDAIQSKTPGTFGINAVQSKTPGTFGVNAATPTKPSDTFEGAASSSSQTPSTFQFNAMPNKTPGTFGVGTAPTHTPGTFQLTSTVNKTPGPFGFGSTLTQTPGAFQSSSAANKAPGIFGTSTGPSLTPGTFGAGFMAPNPSQIGYGLGPDTSINPLTGTSPAMSNQQSPKQTSPRTVEFGSPNDNMQISPPVTPAKNGAEQATGTNSLFSRIEGAPNTNVLGKIESSHATALTPSSFGAVAQTPVNPNIFASPNAAFLAAATQDQPISLTSTASADTKQSAPSSTFEQPASTQPPSAPSLTFGQPADTRPADTQPAPSTQVENNTDTGNSNQTSPATASNSNIFGQSSLKSPVTQTANIFGMPSGSPPIFGTPSGSSQIFGQSPFSQGAPATKSAPAANASESPDNFTTSSNAFKFASASPTDKFSPKGPSLQNPPTDSIANAAKTTSKASTTSAVANIGTQEQSKVSPSLEKAKRSMPDLLRSLNSSLVRHLMSIVPDADLSPVCEAYLYERKRLLELETSGASTSEEQLTSSSSPSKKRKAGSGNTKETPTFSPASDTASFFQNLIKKTPLSSGTTPTSQSSSTANPFQALTQPTSQSSGLFTPKPASKSSSANSSTTPATSRSVAIPKPRKTPISSANAGASDGGFKPSLGATSSSSGGFTPSFASSAATTNFMSQFGQMAAQNAEKEKKKRKVEEFDSEEETEAEWEAKDAKRRRQMLEKVSQQSGGKMATFEPGKGFSFQPSDESRNNSDVEQRSDSGNVQTSKPLGTAKAAPAASAFASFAATARASQSPSAPSPNLKVPGAGDSASNIFGHVSDANTSVHGDDEDSDDSLFEERGTKGSKRSADLISDEVSENDFGAAQKKRKPSPPAAPALNVEGTSSNAGKSLFERITPADKSSSGEDRSDRDLRTEDRSGDDEGDNTAEDHTWKPATPIKFGQDDAGPSLNVTSPTPEKTSTDVDASKTSPAKVPFELFPGISKLPRLDDPNRERFDFGPGLKIPTGPPPPIPTTAACFGSFFKRSTGSTPSSFLQTPNPFDKVSGNSPGISSGATSPSAAASGSEEAKEDDTAEKPVIQLDLTALTEQELKDEEVLFEVRAKCLRQHKTESGATGWETKGAGPLRILKHKTTGVVRLLGRAAPSGKIIVNSLLNKNFDYIRASAKTATMYVVDADGKPERNVIRMASDDDIKRFVKLCEENKPGNTTGSP